MFLIFLLKEIFNEKLKAFNSQYVSIDEFEKKISSFGFSIPTNFYTCDLFKENGFHFNREMKRISRNIY